MDPKELHDRLRAIERQLTVVSQHLGIDCPPFPGALANDGLPDDVLELAQQGNMIGAIKRLRELTGMGLAEAKAAIEPYA